MSSIIDDLTGFLSSDDLWAILDSDAISDDTVYAAMAEVADATLRAEVPAIAMAEDACISVSDECKARLADLKIGAVRAVCQATGLSHVVDALVAALSKIPSSVRTELRTIKKSWDAVTGLLHGRVDLAGLREAASTAIHWGSVAFHETIALGQKTKEALIAGASTATAALLYLGWNTEKATALFLGTGLAAFLTAFKGILPDALLSALNSAGSALISVGHAIVCVGGLLC